MRNTNHYFKYSIRALTALLVTLTMVAGLTACSDYDNPITDPPSQYILGSWCAEQNVPGSFDADGVSISYQKVVQYASFRENGEGFWSIIFVDEDGHAIDIPGYFCGGNISYVDKTNNTIGITITNAGIPILEDLWDVTYANGKLYVPLPDNDHYMAPITDEQNVKVQRWLRELGLGGVNIVDLATLQTDYIAMDGDVLTGTLGGNYQILIEKDAIVTLDGVTINSSKACIKCQGNATIILADESTNTLTSTSTGESALMVGEYETTLTIQGSTGVLNVKSGNYCAGIGGGYGGFSGNVVIEGGVLNVTGGDYAAGIGSDYFGCCGDITIKGGTVTAIGGHHAPAIGSGYDAECGNITITKGITKVTAKKGGGAPDIIGIAEGNSHCRQVTFSQGRASRVAYNGYWEYRILNESQFGGMLLLITEYRYGDIPYAFTLEPLK